MRKMRKLDFWTFGLSSLCFGTDGGYIFVY